MAPTNTSGNLPDHVDYLKPLGITWEVSLDGGANWVTPATSDNTLYITLSNPITALRNETLFAVGSRNAIGKTTNGDAVLAIWGDFTDRDVKKADGITQMRYWNPPTASCQTLTAMLADATGNGTCIAWSQLLKAVFEVQGITGSQIYQLTPIYTNDPGTGGDPRGRLLVKKWNFSTGSAPSSFAPFTHLPGEYADDPTGAAGQGNPNPPGAFFNHFILKYSGQYYDPSYGSGPFTSQEAWENASLDGFEKTFSVVIGGVSTNVRMAKENSPGLETSFTLFP
jgi:hypothetical protein